MWDSSFSWVTKDYPSVHKFMDVVEVVGQHSQRLDLFAIVAWFVWCRRNKLSRKECFIPDTKVFEHARAYLLELQHRPQSITVATSPQVKESKWLPPTCGGIKTNYDGATFVDSGEAGIGVIVRLDSGEVLAALSKKISLPSSVIVLEALAARRATQ